jgi:hypothetical protein
MLAILFIENKESLYQELIEKISQEQFPSEIAYA